MFNKLGIDDGLPSNTVAKIIQDQKGFVWFATADGLARFDGYNLTIFQNNPSDSTSISNNIIFSLYEDSSGIIWVGTVKGLNSYNPKTEKFSNYKNNLGNSGSEIISAIYEFSNSKEKYLWIGTYMSGLLKFYPDRKLFEKVDVKIDSNKILELSSIFSIKNGSENEIWISTHKNGLINYNKREKTFTQFSNSNKSYKLSENHIISIYYSKELDKLFIGTGNTGLNILDEENGTVEYLNKSSPIKNSISHNRVLTIKKIDNEIWIGTAGGGLNIFNTKTKKFQSYMIEKGNKFSISDNFITDIFQTNSGVVFISSNGNGINIYNPETKNINSIIHDQVSEVELSNDVVNCITTDESGNLWLATSKGLNKYNIKTKTNEIIEGISRELDLRELTYNTLLQSKIDKDILWIGTFREGLIKFNKKTKLLKRYNETDGLNGSTISSLLEDKHGNLWIGTAAWGMKYFDTNTEIFTDYLHDPNNINSLSSDIIQPIVLDGDSVLWVGTIKGLTKISINDLKFSRKELLKGKNTKSEIIVSLLISKFEPNILWVGTAGSGLLKFDKQNEKVEQFTVSDGLSNNMIMGTLEDVNGILWLSTNKGISKFNPNKKTFVNYSINDGLVSNEFNISSACSIGDTIMCFGGAGGVSYFNHRNMISDTSKPIVILTDLLLFNKKVEVSDSTLLQKSINYLDELILSYSDYVFSIKFTYPNFKKPLMFKFAYKLKGFNEDWIYTSALDRMATFTNIPPGEYIFQVKAANSAGIWNDDYTSLKIVITPPLWKTWWAYSIYIISFILTITLYIRWRIYNATREQKRLEVIVAERTKELNTLNENKDRFFSIVAHDIKTPIIAVLKFSKILKDQFYILTEKEKYDSISDIHDWLSISSRYLSNLLDWSRLQMGKFTYKPQNVILKTVVEDSISVLKSPAEVKEISLFSEIAENIEVFADYEMISIVLTNLLSNAIKFTNRFGKVLISAESISNKIIISVKDNGIGIKAEDINKLFDLSRKIKQKGTENEEGTGLGLILCKELILKNHGEIKAESILNEGTTIIFSLPIGNNGNK
ncbi:MAG: hypothetical protein KKF62_08680 [Bacteroidetes bacterium]|nr:hypothetical protein [Bacteroidota bacterium]MBU1114342.1 hypothetical protein [Bacteroidota bacterium]MBU1797120.1 hypothetical protein [Bacteroidota bacterium]